jgi:hypothetical protein
MRWLKDVHGRHIRLTDERLEHIASDHPEMADETGKVGETVLNPDIIVRSRTDQEAELFYHFYSTTPVTSKYLCVLVKSVPVDPFIITAYFTDSIKRGEILWKK